MADVIEASKDREESDTAAAPAITLQEFLADYGPNKLFTVKDLTDARQSSELRPHFNYTDIQLFCDNDKCGGIRSFQHEGGSLDVSVDSWRFDFVQYRCRNCRQTNKRFALAVSADKRRNGSGQALKLGEYPPFGPPTPARLLRLIQEDRELFLIGRRAETQGMGIGAFVYYRRVVEQQKTRIFDRIISVAEKLGAAPDQISALKQDKARWSFGASAEGLKGVMPQELLIGGHNPLLLLHRALSEGLHARTDQECLQLAETIRLILVEFSDRCAEILKSTDELNAAVTRLLNPPVPQETRSVS